MPTTRPEAKLITSTARIPAWLRYTSAIAITLVFSAALGLLEPVFPLGYFPFAYILIVSLTAFFFGLGPALAALFISFLTYVYLFVSPARQLWPLALTTMDVAAIAAMAIGSVLGGTAGLAIRNYQYRVERLADELHESNEQKTTILNSITDGFFTMDNEWRYTYVDPVSERLFGKSKDELIGRSMWDIFPDAVDTIFYTEYMKTKTEQQPRTFEGYYGPLDRWFEAHAYPTPDGMTVYIQDITRRKRAEEALRESEEKFRLIAETATDAIIKIDENSIIQYANPATEKIFGYSTSEMLGMNLTMLMPERLRQAHLDGVRRYIATGKKTRPWQGIQFPGLHKNGREIPLEMSYSEYEKGGRRMFVGIVRDITERVAARQREEEIELGKMDFYRRTISAATEGKLEITDEQVIRDMVSEPLETWSINSPRDVGATRSSIIEVAREAGMDEDRVEEFIHCIGEAATNAYKHAGGGTASLHRIDGDLIAVVQDNGPGIEALALPELALKRGYTTAVSLGMGYKVMISMADKVYLATGPNGTTVAIRMALHKPAETVEIPMLLDTWPGN